ncbi:MAG: YdcF family protein [Alkalibacterium sp.]|nr:YdcF family protein [Alkalibacterium sp.]
MDGKYVTIQDYKGDVETAKLIPVVGSSFNAIEDLSGVVRLLEKWQYKTALKELNHLIAAERELIDSLLLKAEVLALFDYNKETIEVCEEVLERDPDNIYAIIMRLIQLIIIKENPSLINKALMTLKQRDLGVFNYFTGVLEFIDQHKLRFDYDLNGGPIDLICVFGYFLNEDGTMPLKLIQRLEKVKHLAEQYPDATILLSGGAVQNQYCEAVEMKRELHESGIEEERLVSLERARDTVGNIIEFMDYIKPRHFSRIAVVTSRDHLPRAWMSLYMGLKTDNYDAHLVGAAPKDTIGHMDKEIRLSYQTVFRIAGLFEKQGIKKLVTK